MGRGIGHCWFPFCEWGNHPVTDPLGELKNSLRRGAPPPDAASIRLPEVPSAAYAVGRFLLSWAHSGELGADQAVLLRQALRWSGVSSLFLGPSPVMTPDFLHRLIQAGVDFAPDGELRVRRFAPTWST